MDAKVVEQVQAKDTEFEEVVKEYEEKVFPQATPEAPSDLSANPEAL